MSDTSEDEDLSRFRESVDTTFTKLIDESRGKPSTSPQEKRRSERYLEFTTHYNDVKVSKEVQKRIGAKVSAVINKNIEFVDIPNNSKKRKIKGGVKLFRDSVEFLTCEEVQDRDFYTEIHNKISKRIKSAHKRREIDDIKEPNEKDKLNSVVVSGDYVSKGEKMWRPKRKNKIFEYKAVGNNKNNLIIGVK